MAVSSSCHQPAVELSFNNDDLLSLDTHPQQNILATGKIQGQISLYEYGPALSSKDHECHVSCIDTIPHDDNQVNSCRSLKFSKSGKYLYGGFKDCTLTAFDVKTMKPIRTLKNAHNDSINKVHPVSERLLATGDEVGCIKVWDTRAEKEVVCFKENSDFISDITSMDSNLLCTSGDGSLTVIDLRQKKLDGKSDNCESELLSLCLIKGGTHVVTGNGEGVLGIFKWNVWGDIIERYPIQPATESVDSLIQVSDSVLCAGGMDGKIRAVQILPNKLVNYVVSHSPTLPVDELCLTWDKQFLVSGSFDCIKFWPTQDIPTMWVEPEKESEEEVRSTKHRRKKKRKHRKELALETIKEKRKCPNNNKTNFFSDL